MTENPDANRVRSRLNIKVIILIKIIFFQCFYVNVDEIKVVVAFVLGRTCTVESINEVFRLLDFYII